MQIKEVINVIENLAPISFQESYDNTGMQVGNISREINSILLTLDVTEETINEAVENKIDLIISHHPVIFNGIKKLSGRNATERIVIKAIKNDIAIYSCHTNIDSAWNGVNIKLAEKFGLQNIKILKTISGNLRGVL